jgi:hypothetical protein
MSTAKFITLKEFKKFIKETCPNLYVNKDGSIFIKNTCYLTSIADLGLYEEYHADGDNRIKIGQFDECVGTSIFYYGHKKNIFAVYNTDKEKAKMFEKIYNILFSEKEKIRKIILDEANRLHAIANKIWIG